MRRASGLAARPTARRRAGIYCRISQDAQGEGLGVARQRLDAERLAESRGWTVSDVFVDNDMSAYSGKPRPEYLRLLEAIEGGDVDAVIAWHPDRLHRSPLELEEFIDLVERSDVEVETVQAGRFDLATAAGRMQARLLGNVARYESEHKSDRIKAKMDELAKDGKPTGSARAFGYDRPRSEDGTPIRGSRPVVIPEEAQRIREAADRVLAGESLYAIVQDWSAEGVPTVRGAQWSTTALKTVLTSPRVAGLRVHRGDVIGKAQWDPILDEPTWQKVRGVLTAPGRKVSRGKRPYLLTGMLRCGLCGHGLVATPRAAKTGGGKRGLTTYGDGPSVRCYGCVKANGGCGSVFILAEPVESLVTEAVLRRVDGALLHRARERLSRGDHDDQRLLRLVRDLEEQLAELGRDFYVERAISRTVFDAANEGLEAQLAEHRESLAAQPSARALDTISDLRAEWGTLSIERQRAIINAVLAEVTIGPAKGPRNRFDPERIDFPPGCWKA